MGDGSEPDYAGCANKLSFEFKGRVSRLSRFGFFAKRPANSFALLQRASNTFVKRSVVEKENTFTSGALSRIAIQKAARLVARTAFASCATYLNGVVQGPLHNLRLRMESSP